MKRLIAAVPLVLLAACQAPASNQNQLVDQLQAKDQCKASSRQNLVGTSAASLDRSTLPKLSRVIYPKSPVTMDFRVDRLNVYVDESGKIERVDCG